jgi:hypothetical protein
LLETGEDLVGRDGRDSAGIDVFDAALDLGFPVLTQAVPGSWASASVTYICHGFHRKAAGLPHLRKYGSQKSDLLQAC